MTRLHKYPRTPHLEGSAIQPGDEDLAIRPLNDLAGRYLVVEEKLDGANSAVSFDAAGHLLLQSRGHFLSGGPRERHFALFKAWAASHQARLFEVLGSRYVMFGEWLYAKHTLFYDILPHYFLEFDVLDTRLGQFLSTERRRALLAGLPIVSAPVLFAGPAPRPDALRSLIGPSRFKTENWREHLREDAVSQGLDPTLAAEQTDASTEMEGLYLKVEAGDVVVERYKLVRESFRTAVRDAESHWLERPIVPNRLRDGVDLFRANP